MKEYWCETFGAWPVEDDMFQIRLKHYPLLIGFTYDEYMTFKKDICKAKVNKNEFFLQDLNTIRIYNGTRLSENMIYTIMKEKDVVFGLDYETFDYFKQDISEFSPLDMKELGEGEVKFRDYEDESKKIRTDKLTYLTEPKHNLKNLFFDKETKNQIDDFIAMVENKDLIFKKWGLSRLNRGNEQLFAFFSGVPGTGKSAAAEAIAKKFKKKILSINISNMISKWYDESEKNVTKLFRKYASKDVLLLFDEADALLSKRVPNNDRENMNSVKNVLLQELEKYSGVVIFTSNLASNIDPAFERRIQFKIEFKAPGIDERIEILKRLIKRTNAPFPKKIEYKNICNYELTGGELRNLLTNAAIKGARRKNKKITNSDLIESAKQIITGKQMFKTNYLYTSKYNNSKKDTSYI